MGLLGEMVLGNVRLFVNAENILNVRQTREDPLVRPVRGRMWEPCHAARVDARRVSGGK